MNTPKHEQLIDKITSAAQTVYDTLGCGFLDDVYMNALAVELRKRGLRVAHRRLIEVIYKGNIVGDYPADLVVENKVIIEVKTVPKINKVHEMQLVSFLAATGTVAGLLFNFEEKLETRRIYFYGKRNHHQSL